MSIDNASEHHSVINCLVGMSEYLVDIRTNILKQEAHVIEQQNEFFDKIAYPSKDATVIV